MMDALKHPLVVLAAIAVAFWDAWRWYAQRVSASPEEAIALLMTAALVVAIGLRTTSHFTDLHPVPLMPLAIAMAGYAAAHAIIPSIGLAAIAVTSMLFALYRTLTGLNPPLAFYGLAALALPVVPSLQFVLGYPMRVISASITVGTLQMQGLAVTREGTHMLWGGQTIQFDAPCSGVNMLWAGLMLTLAASVVWRSGLAMTLIAVTASLVLTIIANVLRAVSLFYVEAGLIAGAQPWWHDAIGIAAFVLSAIATIAVLQTLRQQQEETLWVR